MNHKQKSDDDLRYLILRYCGVSLAVMFGSAIVKMAFALLGLQALSSSTLLVTTALPAIDAGFGFVRRFRRLPEKDEAWLLSAVLSIVGLLLSFAILYLLDALSSENLMAQVKLAGTLIFAAILAMIMIPLLLITRVSLGFGAKIELRRLGKLHQEKQQ